MQQTNDGSRSSLPAAGRSQLPVAGPQHMSYFLRIQPTRENMAADDNDPLDLRQFLAAAEAAADDENGFDLDEVLAVEEAWEQDDDGEVRHGFIVALRSGDRLYL